MNTSTVGFWVRGGIQLLTRIYTRIQQKILSSPYLLGDETTLKVLDRDKALGKHLGYIWGYLAPLEKLVFMEYQEGRAAAYPEAFLKNYSGVFQTDAYAGYDKLGTEREGITHIACWAHARRNFFKAELVDKVRAAVALERIHSAGAC